MVLAGRPYHVDPEINHGLEKILLDLGMAVLSEDSVSAPKSFETANSSARPMELPPRLYDAADFVGTRPDLELVHLVSFGCGVDAVTSSKCRRF
ncbi:MAG: acyl-CoA dehydratase activase-related protein [Clostridia bacterium]